ncbi:hypothetical protein PTNB73_07910 [Pyrenophora teres f. teres]|nr:hypothetical protein HRS9122_07161 [Pyrenophora teres f. teres]KAE8860300.1 hypothetical protein PTNB73_07910 [Pyrenophora teres f. teres]
MASKKGLLRRQSTAESSFLHRQFASLGLSSRTRNSESNEETRGPLGLTVLYEPAEPLIDFVFVHGLRGGSRKTWSKSANPAHFWPKEWLPLEPHFKHVRIHTFGYNSDWMEKKGSIVTVHDFGQALLGDLYNSPSVGGPGIGTPIVLVAHSMGGIVVKKVLILAKQDPYYHDLADRIHSMFFLATPHRGSDSAHLLGVVLQASGLHGNKSYVENLVPNSEAIHTINDQFRHVNQNIQLWSFFETMTTTIGLIVEKDSAILGLPNERIQLMNADHRNICKFEDPSDTNYCTLRNAFGSAISSIENTWLSTRRDEHQSEMRRLTNFFGHPERPESDLGTVLDRQTDGSCTWLTEKHSFHTWREGLEETPKIFWLRGEPATGKSTVTGHVIRYLEDSSAETSYFFFKHGIKGKSTIADMLWSLAWQMAHSNSTIRQRLLKMHEDGVTLDHNDASLVWRTVFRSQIFQTELRQPHFWIIDALDECANCATLCSLLGKIEKNIRLRVFISSRPDLTIERSFSQEKITATVESTSLETSLQDIQLFLDIHANDLPVDSDEERAELLAQILHKSNGNFLWTTLVVKELEDTVSRERIGPVLESVPNGIDKLYSRILQTITSGRNAEVAKAILRWIACSARPLTVEELKDALIFDINETVPQLEKHAGAICGNLVRVDHAGKVYPAHQTVKEYLFRPTSSDDKEFALDGATVHARLSEICLNFLCSDSMKTIRYRRSTMSARKTHRAAFTNYAITHFSTHLARATSSDDRHLIALNKFFLTNTLTWIELVAAKNDLNVLTETAKNIKGFMERRAKYRSPLGKEVQNGLEWADELIRLVAQFGRALVSNPSAIHFLVPPVCPPESIIFRTFSNYPRPLKLVGLSQTGWNDRLSCISCSDSQPLCVASHDNKLVLGLQQGSIKMYHEKTFQKTTELTSGEPVRSLAFTHVGGLLASAGRRRVKLWHLTSGECLWTASISDLPLAFEFSEDDHMLLAATRDNRMTAWDTTTGEVTTSFAFSDFDEEEGSAAVYHRPPIYASFSPELGLLGVAYRSRPVNFWELETGTYAGQYHKTGAIYPEPLIHAFLFNPIPEICLAAVAFQDGDIAVFDPWSQNTQAMVHCDSACLAASPNGTILASGNLGVIKLFDFESLRLLYQINSHEENIRSIVFSTDGMRFHDIRGDHCNVWEPSVLIRRTNCSDESSVDPSDRVGQDPTVAVSRTFDDDQEITAIAEHHEGEHLFCGFEDGHISIYSTARGKAVQSILQHPANIAILFLEWNDQRSILASVDRTGRVLIHRIRKTNGIKEPFACLEKVLEIAASTAISSILFNTIGKRLLVVRGLDIELWDLEKRELKQSTQIESTPSSAHWFTHPLEPTKLLLMLDDGHVRSYLWDTLETQGISHRVTHEPSLVINAPGSWVSPSHAGQSIIAMAAKCEERDASFCVLPSKSFSGDNESVAVVASYPSVARAVKCMIGCYKTSVLFLNHDDWICSLSVDSLRQEESYTKHFFIPQQWQGSGMETLLMRVTKRGSIILVSRDEMAVFHGGLDFEERVTIPVRSNRAQSPLLKRPTFKKGTSSPVP